MIIRTAPMSTLFFFLMIRRPPRSTLDRSSAASDVYKRQSFDTVLRKADVRYKGFLGADADRIHITQKPIKLYLSLIHISEPTRPY